MRGSRGATSDFPAAAHDYFSVEFATRQHPNPRQNPQTPEHLLHDEPVVREGAMPVISRFFGISIVINFREHSPPHFHARYGGKEVSIAIRDFASARRLLVR